MIGQQIDGKYEIIAVLGSGAMGAVYEARNIATGRSVAVKVIQSGLGTDPALVARFQREARAAGAIESTHIAQVLDAGQDRTNDAPYLVMELLKGEDLDTLIRRLGTIRYGLALRIIAQALAGLEKAHGVGVVHRDIKPANLFIAVGDAGQRVVKLVDFGIAKVKDELAASNHALTQTSALLGSPLYMSPEQAKASKKVDARADLWSLGVVLYQLLTGKAPHAHAESLTELLLAICTENATPVQQVAPWVPANVAEIVERAVRLDPAKRFDSAQQMRDAIAAIVPDWNVLSETMLTPLTDEERAFIAEPAADLAALGVTTGPARDDPRSASGGAMSGSGSALALGGATNLLPLDPSASQHSPPALAKSAGAGTGTGAALGADSLAGTSARRSARIMPLAIGAVALALGLGFVGFRTLRSSDKGGLSSGMVAAPTAETPPSGPAASSATSTPAPSASASASASSIASASTAPSTTAPATTSARGRPTSTATPAGTPTASPASTAAATTAGTAPKPTAPATTKPPPPTTTSTSPISREFN
ncbi:MAG: serine/threonine protein kinase [Myxococcaceae bacterium]|nr:serine/threonine protein kinase [Myxococcaceae bacterium]